MTWHGGPGDPLVVECEAIRPYLLDAIKRHGDRKSLATYLGVCDRQLVNVLTTQKTVTLTVADRWFQRLGLCTISSIPEIQIKRNPAYSEKSFARYFESRGDPVPVDVIS